MTNDECHVDTRSYSVIRSLIKAAMPVRPGYTRKTQVGDTEWADERMLSGKWRQYE